jgi:hypothetical protein
VLLGAKHAPKLAFTLRAELGGLKPPSDDCIEHRDQEIRLRVENVPSYSHTNTGAQRISGLLLFLSPSPNISAVQPDGKEG